MLEIGVLGEFTVSRDSVPRPLPPSRKTRALLAYLAIVNRPQRRERLCEMFWEIPDDPRGALRWSLHKIRHAVDAEGETLLEADRNVVHLDSSRIALDVAPLLSISQQDLDALDIDVLEGLAARFRGSFLADLSLPRCPDYEAWRIGVANELEVTRLRLLRLLVNRLASDPGRALVHAHALHALEPDDAGLKMEIVRLADAARRSALAQAADVAEPDRSVDAAARPTMRRGQEIRFCSAPDGVRLAYALSGQGMPIVRAPHWMSHLELDWESPVWRHWTEALSAQNTFVRYDQRGNGLSQRDVTDVSFEAMVSDLESIVDAAGFRRFFLLGISQGCAVSIAYAIRHPERVAGMILFGGFAKGWRKRGDPAEVAKRSAMAALIREGWGQADPVFRQMFTSLFIPEGTQEQMNWFNELQRLTVDPAVAHDLMESNSVIDVENELAKVRAPALIMHSRGDRVIPFANGEVLARNIPGARFVALESVNHILLGHEPAFQEFVAHTRSFIADPEATAMETNIVPATGIERSRQNVTMLAAQVDGPINILEEADPETSAQQMNPLQERLIRAIEAHDGLVTSNMDGTVMAAFGLITATEDHAYLASRAALAARIAIEEASKGDATLKAGLDTGEVIVGWNSAVLSGRPDLSGAAPRIASRVMHSLRRPAIAATARARVAIGGYAQLRLLPPSDHAGSGVEERIFELIGENQALSRWHLRANRGLTGLVGREAEFNVLHTAWRRVREGSGQVVGIVGDPGLGKSRLAHEFLASAEVKGFDILEAGALEFDSRTALGLMKKLLLSACGISVAEELAPARARLINRCEELDLAAHLLTPLRFLADMPVEDGDWNRFDASERNLRISEALRAFFVAMSRRAPLVILFEDLHWIDPESRLVLDRLSEGAASCRILLICTYRPTFAHDWNRRSWFHEIRLQHFLRQEAREFLGNLLGEDSKLDPLRDLLAEQAEGTPLYLEEMVRMLVEKGQLQGTPGAYQLNDKVAAIELPASIQVLVASRIFRLAAADRIVLQLAAVIGRNVPLPLLSMLAPMGSAELAQSLARLQAQEFLFEVQSIPYSEYMFKHAITQRVAYDGVLSVDRKRLHREIISAMERLHQDSLTHHIEALAEHAMRAEEWGIAIRYAREAAARAEERSAYETAARFLEDARHAVSMLDAIPEAQAAAIDVAVAMRPIYGMLGDYEKAAVPLAAARRMAEELGDRNRLHEVLLHQSYLNSTFGRFEEALEAAETMKSSALTCGASRCIAEADLAGAQALLLRSRAEEAIERLAPHRASFLGEWRHERFGQTGVRSVWFLGHLAQAEARLGRFAEAEESVALARATASEFRRPVDLSAVIYFAGIVDVLRGPTEAIVEEMQRLVRDDHSAGGHIIRCWILTVLGHAQFSIGDLENACATLEEAISVSERSALIQCETHARAVLACARTRLGLPEATSNLAHALDLARQRGDVWSEILILRGMAESKPARNARPYLEQACEIARRHAIRPELMRSLALLGLSSRTPDGDAAMAEAARLHAEMGIRDAPIVRREVLQAS